MKNNLKNDPRYKNHESRPDLAGEHPQGDRFQFVGLIIFLLAIVVDILFLGWSSIIRNHIPFALRLIMSMIFIMLGGYMALKGIHTVFSDFTEKPRIYTSGLFSFVRHPVYLGALLVYVGIIIFLLPPLAFLVFLGVFWLYDWLAEDEEKRMLNLFGATYQNYLRQTPRWLPRLFRKK